MFITFTPNQVHFCYGKNSWYYAFEEIIELGLVRKKKNHLFINVLFGLVTAVAYYCMLFTKIPDLYYIIPSLMVFAILTILRFHDTAEFDYYVLVRDCYQKEITVKIKSKDRPIVGKQIDIFSSIQFAQTIKKTA
ncbi:hypothetical protein [Flavobacterium mesophilum]|uniref:hypothetical protein n=1 Tax=Flavobacterium mesophilum TaxID=3143495 RepID=UPI0031DD0F2F